MHGRPLARKPATRTSPLLPHQLLRSLSKEKRQPTLAHLVLNNLPAADDAHDGCAVSAVDSDEFNDSRLSGSRIGHWHTQRMRIE